MNKQFEIKDLAIPLCCNIPQDKMDLYLEAISDSLVVVVSLYKHDGVYWFCFEYVTDMNSVGFVSLRTCVSALFGTLVALGFRLRGSHVSVLDRLVRESESPDRCSSVKGLGVRVPTSWRV